MVEVFPTEQRSIIKWLNSANIMSRFRKCGIYPSENFDCKLEPPHAFRSASDSKSVSKKDEEMLRKRLKCG